MAWRGAWRAVYDLFKVKKFPAKESFLLVRFLWTSKENEQFTIQHLHVQPQYFYPEPWFYKVPLNSCSRSMASNNALKFPFPKEVAPFL